MDKPTTSTTPAHTVHEALPSAQTQGFASAQLHACMPQNKAPIDPIPRENMYVYTTSVEYALAEFYAFNTKVSLQAPLQAANTESLFASACAECRRYERLFSRTLPHSDITRINTAMGMSVEVSQDTYRLLQSAQYYCEQSEGTFDITIGPAISLWNFTKGICAEKESLAQAVNHIDWRALSLRADASGTLFAQLSNPHASIDVGGIAKGYIADRLTDLFIAHGLSDFSLNLGGNVVVRGQNAHGTPWVVGIRDPRHPGNESAVLGALEISNASVVTSGTAERSFVHNGIRYHHILSPHTGMPVQTDVASATVIAKQSIDAEGFSTTLVALGIEKGREFAHAHSEIAAAIFIDTDNNLYQA